MIRTALSTAGRRRLFGAFLGSVAVVGSATAQEEIGKKDRERVVLEWAKTESRSYAIEYESVIAASSVKRVGDELDEVLEQYVAVFRYKPKEKFKVRFLDNLNTWEQEGGDPSHPGFFQPRSGYLYLLDKPFFDLIPTAYHEAFHQYLQAYIGEDAEIPLWFNEGLAVYFEGIQRNKGTRKLDSKLVDNRRMRRLQEAIFTRQALPLAGLVDATPETFHDKEKEELHYSQSFALVYFLMQGMGAKPVFAYAKELKETKDVGKANEKIFGKDRKNLPRIETTWKGYVARLKIQDAPPR